MDLFYNAFIAIFRDDSRRKDPMLSFRLWLAR